VIGLVYTIEELKKRIEPVATKYNLPAVYLFGSYAKGEATEDSDVDILVDKEGTGFPMVSLRSLYRPRLILLQLERWRKAAPKYEHLGFMKV
jgi:predicted nucleotidyltransferase